VVIPLLTGTAERRLRFFKSRRAGPALANLNGADSAKAPLYPFIACVENAGENGSLLAEGLVVVGEFELLDACEVELVMLEPVLELEYDAEQLVTTTVLVFAIVWVTVTYC